MLETKDILDQYTAAFEAIENAGQRPWLLPIRKASFARFTETGFPTTRHEDWKYTNVAPVAEKTYEAGAAEAGPSSTELSPFLLDGRENTQMVFVNGRYAPALSSVRVLPTGTVVEPLSEALSSNRAVLRERLTRAADDREDAFASLNTALFEDGVLIALPPGAIVEEPIHLVFASYAGGTPTMSHPRVLVFADRDSQATIVESYAGCSEGIAFSNAVTEIVTASNANIDHYKVGRENEASYHVGTLAIRQGRDSRVRSHAITFGGQLVRNTTHAVMEDENAECVLNGLYVLSGHQHADNFLRVEHAKPNCRSWEYFKGVLDERSHGVFTGRIYVAENAQKTDAKQTNKTLLLSDDARIDSKPQLEIFADDVRCTHGATIGQIDDEAMFYLRSRGLNPDLARGLLIYAFAGESLDQIRPAALRSKLEGLLFERLPGGSRLQEA